MNPPNLKEKPGLQSRRRIRTLLVDDSQLMREFLTILIGRESGFELVGTAADGRQALHFTAALRPELILMDVQMPLMDGIAATRIIKRFGAQIGYAPLIVIVTSEDTLECRSRAKFAGANGFVPKSEHLRVQLISTLENLLSGNFESLPVHLIETGHESSRA
jgi:DNA-binding NarL/FixJ family response regulator